MENPLNPLGGQDPLGGIDPLGDPMLDAIENSIVGPPGFLDPMAQNDDPFMDDLARQLGQVESGIENGPQMPPGLDEATHGNEPNICGEGAEDIEIPMLPDNMGAPESDEFQGFGTFDALGSPATQDLPTSSSGIGRLMQELPSKASGIRRPRGPAFKSHAGGRRGGRTGARAGDSARICPESRESIEGHECEECQKYRRWPEGTAEEPRECWYDWQLRSAGNGTFRDDDDEY